jgi:hypothetical protein
VTCRYTFPDCMASQMFTLTALGSPHRNVFSCAQFFSFMSLNFRSKPLLHSDSFPPSKNAISLFLTLFFDVIFALFSAGFLSSPFLYRLFSIQYPLLVALLCSGVFHNVIILGRKFCSDLRCLVFRVLFRFIFLSLRSASFFVCPLDYYFYCVAGDTGSL